MFLRKVVDRPMYAYVAKHHFASIRVLEKCGFGFCEKSTYALDKPADEVEELVYIIKPAFWSVLTRGNRPKLFVPTIDHLEMVLLADFNTLMGQRNTQCWVALRIRCGVNWNEGTYCGQT